jgi:3-hydroxyacyl-[acyl-carrier-protein] dehydratase
MKIERVGALGVPEIRAFLPHREPFLFVDRILEVIPGKDAEGKTAIVGTTAKGVKRFTGEEDFFRGHFPGYPITPGVIVTESCGQIGCFVFYPFLKEKKLIGADGEPLKLAGVNEGRFRRPVLPGDEITATVTIKRGRKSLWFFECKVEVGGEPAADMELIANFDLKVEGL